MPYQQSAISRPDKERKEKMATIKKHIPTKQQQISDFTE